MKKILALLASIVLFLSPCVAQQSGTAIAVDPTGRLAFLNTNSLGQIFLAQAGHGITNAQSGVAVALNPSGTLAYLNVDSTGGLIVSGGGTGGGTVNSVALTAPGNFTVTGSPVTASGTLGFGWTGLTTNGILQANNSTTVGSTLTPSGLTSLGVNGLLSAALSPLTLGTGTFGTAVTFASATGIPTFVTSVVVPGVNSPPATDLTLNVPTGQTLHLAVNSADTAQIVATAINVPSTVTSGVQLFNTTDQVTNFERLSQYWTGNVFRMGIEHDGTGADRSLILYSSHSSGSGSYNGIEINPPLTAVGAGPYVSVQNIGNLSGNSSYNFFGVSNPGGNGWTNTAGTGAMVYIAPIYNQASGTASNTDILVNRTQTAVGSGTQRLLDLQVGSTSIANFGSTVFGALTTGTGVAFNIPATTYTVTGTSTVASMAGTSIGATTFTNAGAGLITDASVLQLFGPAAVAGSQQASTRSHTLAIYDVTGPSGVQSGAVVIANSPGSGTSVGIGGGMIYTSGAINIGGASTFSLPIQYGGLTRTTAAFTATSNTVLANITALTVNVVAGNSYMFRVWAPTTATTAGGVQFAIAGTATATYITYEGNLEGGGLFTQTRAAALATAVCSSATATTSTANITGSITVNAGGTLTVQFAQATSNAAASTVLQGSYFEVWQTSN